MSVPFEITPAAFKQRIEDGEKFYLVDVREPEEHRICRIEGATLIPLGDIPQQLERLEQAADPLVLFCHHGVRSMRAVEWLRQQGLEDCQSLAGGIDAWSLQVDPAVPRY